ncbi:glycoside hydrolase family 71 protein [Schizophyllum commune]
MHFPTLTLLASVLGLVARAAPVNETSVEADAVGNRLVFAHFMIGITADRTSASDYDDDMRRAKAAGIDAFALNIGMDPYTDGQLEWAYQSAQNNGMKVFISFDFNWYAVPDPGAVGRKIAQYAGRQAQLQVDGKVFASSFAGDGLNVAAVRQAAGVPVFWAPNFHPGGGDFSQIDGALNWMAWQNNGANKAPSNGNLVTVNQGDQGYLSALAGKAYIARGSANPALQTHFGPEVPYSKNWVFPSDMLFYRRWLEILQTKPRFVEIVTWNDYGESHYVGPLSSKHNDDGASKWVNDMPHSGWLDMAKPFIAAFKAGASTPNAYIAADQLVYWYRVTPKALNCDPQDTTMNPANNDSGNYFMGRPNGFDSMADNIFVVPLLKTPGTVTVNSGGTLYTFDAPAGASAYSLPFHVGAQAFSLSRNGKQVLSGTSLRPVQNTCPCGLYNFNAYVGTVPAGPADALGPDGLNHFATGLRAACAAQASLPASPPAVTAPTTTIRANPISTSLPV